MTTFDDLLKWILSPQGGAVIIVTFAISWFIQDYAWWQNFKPNTQKLVILGIAVLLGIGATYLQLNPQVYDAIKPYLQSVITITVAWLGLQTAHKVDKKTQ